eukprot:Rmarinus@m.13842
MCVCVYVCMCVCVYVYVCICMCVWVCSCVRVCVYICVTGSERGYHVEIAMGTSRPPLFSDTVTGVGEHFVDIQVPAVRAKTSLTLHMTADNGLTYCDTFTLGFHLSLYRWVKWILLLPLMGFGAVIFFGKNVSRLEETPNLGHY